MAVNHKTQSKRILFMYAIGVLAYFMIINTPIIVPCLWKFAIGIPCPACGLTRAFTYASQLHFIEAIRVNILFIPLLIGFGAYFICALIDLLSNKDTIKRFNSFMLNKRIITFIVLLTAVSWYYNISRGI